MNPPTVGRDIFRRSGSSATLFIGAVIFVSACGGAESSDAAASGSPETAVSAGPGSIAPLGTGFIMVSARSELHLDEPSYLEHSDCRLRVSTLRDVEEFAGCVEIPRTAICLQLAEGYRESDSWWECFAEPLTCEVAAAEHDVVMQLEKGIREILQPCAETELASVFGI